jgi:Flp pilus assembly protein TadG
MNANYASDPANWADFNDAESQQSGFDLIPKGTVVPVRMTIKPGGHDDHSQGWTGGYATQSFETGAVYLAGEFIVTAGPFAKRKMWSNVGLFSQKGPTWGQMGRTFIRAALNSARNVLPQDNSAQAAAARRINGFSDLDGIEFVVHVDVEKDNRGDDRNVIKTVVEPDHKDYGQWSVSLHKASGGGQSGTSAQAAPRIAAPAAQTYAPAYSLTTAQVSAPAAVTGKPSWAQ